jgi:serine protease Do
VVVTEVVPDSPAAEESLQAGDLLVEVSQEPVSLPGEALTKINQAAKDKKTVLLLIDRQGDLRFVALRMKT